MKSLEKIKLILDTSCLQANVIGLLQKFGASDRCIETIRERIVSEQKEIYNIIKQGNI